MDEHDSMEVQSGSGGRVQDKNLHHRGRAELLLRPDFLGGAALPMRVKLRRFGIDTGGFQRRIQSVSDYRMEL